MNHFQNIIYNKLSPDPLAKVLNCHKKNGMLLQKILFEQYNASTILDG